MHNEHFIISGENLNHNILVLYGLMLFISSIHFKGNYMSWNAMQKDARVDQDRKILKTRISFVYWSMYIMKPVILKFPLVEKFHQKSHERYLNWTLNIYKEHQRGCIIKDAFIRSSYSNNRFLEKGSSGQEGTKNYDCLLSL